MTKLRYDSNGSIKEQLERHPGLIDEFRKAAKAIQEVVADPDEDVPVKLSTDEMAARFSNVFTSQDD